jgi:5-methyltetrahydrofolate--homocysteine methyltransferase
MLNAIREAVLQGETDRAAEITARSLREGVAPEEILTHALISAMQVVGEEFESGIRFIPEMLISAEAMKSAMAALRPHLVAAGVPSQGKVVIGTVEGDLHDIGKDLVATMLEGAGFEVIDLGVEVTAEQFVCAVQEHAPHILAMSALLTTTMVEMPKVIQALTHAGLRDAVKVLVGGAPVTRAYALQIGADGYADDASSAVKVARSLIA